MRPLAVDYAFDYARLSDFFAGDPSDARSWVGAIERARSHPRPRSAVADLLTAQQRARHAPAEALAATARLRDEATVAVVTGQQAGLFGGPLFTLLKALTAVKLAEDVATRHKTPVVAIFWIDAEDHDWQEVRECAVLDAEDGLHAISAGDPPGAQVAAVGHVRLDESIGDTLRTLEATLPPTEFTSHLLEGLRRAYQPGVSMADACARWLDTVLGPRGLIVYNAADPAAKPLVSGVFTREIESRGDTSRLALRAGAALEGRGYHAQATPQESGLALFRFDHGRQAIRQQDEQTFVVGDRPLSMSELLALVRQSPEDFSPSVLLRPIVQDTLFPTVGYVSGPSELAYLGQLKDVYALFGVPMPLIVQRATATILDSNAMRFLTRHEFPLEALRARDEAALNELLGSQLPAGIDAAVTRLDQSIVEQMEALASAVKAVDATLEGAAQSTRGRMQDDVQKLHGKIIQAAKRKDTTLRRQFQHAQQQAFPGGQPQERAIGFAYFLNRYGPALVDRLSDVLPGAPGTHYVLTI